MNLTEAIKSALGVGAQATDTQATHMFWTLQTSGKHVYAGTVPAKTIAQRRAANRRARAARRGTAHRAKIAPQARAQRARRTAQVAARSEWAHR